MIAGVSRSPQQVADGGLTAAIEQDLGWNGRYFEVREVDVMNPTLRGLLKAAAARLRNQGHPDDPGDGFLHSAARATRKPA